MGLRKTFPEKARRFGLVRLAVSLAGEEQADGFDKP